MHPEGSPVKGDTDPEMRRLANEGIRGEGARACPVPGRSFSSPKVPTCRLDRHTQTGYPCLPYIGYVTNNGRTDSSTDAV
jgi:hypothetical protein